MTDPKPSAELTAATAEDVASRSRSHAVAAGRWFSRYLVVVGLASAALIAVQETFFPDGWARLVPGLVWLVVMIALASRAERQSVYPVGATRSMAAAMAGWLALYLVVIGPFVRWQFGQHPLAWSVAAVVVSAPFFAAAAWVRRRR